VGVVGVLVVTERRPITKAKKMIVSELIRAVVVVVVGLVIVSLLVIGLVYFRLTSWE